MEEIKSVRAISQIRQGGRQHDIEQAGVALSDNVIQKRRVVGQCDVTSFADKAAMDHETTRLFLNRAEIDVLFQRAKGLRLDRDVPPAV